MQTTESCHQSTMARLPAGMMLAPGGLNLRPATLADADAIIRLGRVAWHATHDGLVRGEDLDFFVDHIFQRTKIEADLSHPGVSVTVAHDRTGRVIGFAKTTWEAPLPCVTGKRPLLLDKLYFAREHVGQGLGTPFLEFLTHDAIERGADTMWLWVNQSNARAISFYEKHGFTKVGVDMYLKGTLPSGRDYEHDIMQRVLTPEAT